MPRVALEADHVITIDGIIYRIVPEHVQRKCTGCAFAERDIDCSKQSEILKCEATGVILELIGNG
jgi:hypothetical protein